MNYFFDTEFIEDGKAIDLISIGVVSEKGLVYYVENLDCDLTRASGWVRRNVIPHLQGHRIRLSQIAKGVKLFVGDSPTFWGYYCAYDWVALCQIYGRMIDIPGTWPMYCRDLRQSLDERGLEDVSQPNDMPHHALYDAEWIRDTWLKFVDKSERVE